MAGTIQCGRRSRKDFGKIPSTVKIPNLIEIQRQSYEQFLQKDVAPAPDADEGFGGLRASIEARRAVSSNAQLRMDVVVDDNLEELEDVRADVLTSLSVAISEDLALKTSLQLLWDNQPALINAPLESTTGTPLGATVPVVGRELDRVVTIALVITL